MSTDQELFDAATSREPTQDAPAEIVAPETQPAVARDEAGRFAGRPEGEQPPAGEEQAQAGSDPKEPPPHRFREVSERARAAEARAEQAERLLQQINQGRQPEAPKTEAAPKPEIWDNPDEWVGQHIGTVKSEVQQTREFYSRRFAEQQHGADKVSEAYDALNRAIGERQLDGAAVKAKLSQSMDPYADIMAWHGEHTLRAEIGNDPKAYEQKIIERYLASQKQPAAGAPAQVGGSVVKLPPNLNRMTSAASDGPGAGDVSDQELFHATTSRRR